MQILAGMYRLMEEEREGLTWGQLAVVPQGWWEQVGVIICDYLM